MTSYTISDLSYTINGSTNTIQYSKLFSDIVPWGINATYIYKSDVVFDTQFDNNNNNDLIIENKRNNIILKTPNTMKTDIKNLAVEKLYIREISTNDFNSCPYIYNDNDLVTVRGNFTVSGNFQILGDLNSTGTFEDPKILKPRITDGTIQRSLISDLSIVNVKIFDSSVNNCSLLNNSLYGTNKLYGTLLGQSSGIREIKDCIFNGGSLKGSISTIDADITNITINQGTLNTCTIKNGSASDISINRFTLSGGIINNSVANNSTINRPTLSGGTISYSVANNLTIFGSTLLSGAIINSVANNLTITGFTLSGGTINNSFFNNNTTDIINLSGGTLTYSNINGSLLTNNSLNGTLQANGIGNINNCYLNDSSINRTSISGGTMTFALINNSLLNDSSINNCLLSGGTLRFALINNSVLNDSSINNTSLSGGTLRNFVVNDSFINNFSLSGGTILATNIGCNDAGIPNIPKRGVFTNINIFNNNNNNLSINSNGNIDTGGTISGANITSSGTLSAGNIISIGAISSGNITSNGTISGANITTPGTLNAGTIIAGTIGSGNITSNSTISSVNNNVSNKIVANSLDIRSGGILDVSQGTIRSNTISGTAITIRSNTSANTCVMNVTTGTQSSTNANGDGVPMNGIAINNRNVATTQHIKNAIPPGIILAYYTSTNPATAPDGWLICDGANNLTPDLRGRFILGADPRRNDRRPNLFGGTENEFLTLSQIPSHTHSDKYTQVGYTGINAGNGGRSVANSHGYFYDQTGSAGSDQSHNNMPPYWILIYIMKTSAYNFDYD